MKTQFSVVYNDFTLEVWQEVEKTINTFLWYGKCEALSFEDGTFHYLDTLVRFFQKAVDEYLKPTKIEYKGYELDVLNLLIDDKEKFLGRSNIYDGWEILLCSKEEVVNKFKKEIDEKDLLSNIKNLERLVSLHQEELEEYLKSKGYMFDSIHRHYPKISLLYAIHPDYWERWAQGDMDFPEGKVVFIRQQ